MTEDRTDIMVCVDCYFAHHYGYRTICAVCGESESQDAAWRGTHQYGPVSHGPFEPQWYAGESDIPADREPLLKVPSGLYVADNTDGETGDGIDEFSWSRCDGCGSTLGGARYRLAVFGWTTEVMGR